MKEAELFLGKSKYVYLQQEFEKFNPKTLKELYEFYKKSQSYLFANARHHHLYSIMTLRVDSNTMVLDFGGGAGSDSIPLAMKGCKVDYYDINELQQKFIKYISDKYGLEINVLSSLPDAHSTQYEYDVVIMRDVIEHFKDYRNVVTMCVNLLRIGGYLVASPNFLSESRDVKEMSLHYPDLYNFPGFCRGLNLRNVIDEVWVREA